MKLKSIIKVDIPNPFRRGDRQPSRSSSQGSDAERTPGPLARIRDRIRNQGHRAPRNNLPIAASGTETHTPAQPVAPVEATGTLPQTQNVPAAELPRAVTANREIDWTS
jgi:hypothetical protein